MIIEMARVRVLGPKALLRATVAALQDLGLLHVVETTGDGLAAHPASPRDRAREGRVRRALAAVEAAIAGLQQLGGPVADTLPRVTSEGRAALAARRLARALDDLAARRRALIDERDALAAYEPLFAELESLLARDRSTHRFSAYLLLLREGSTDQVRALERALDELIGDQHDLRIRTTPAGKAALLLVPSALAEQVDRELAALRVESAPVPAALSGLDLFDALARMRPRLAEVDRALAALADEVRALADRHGPELAAARRAFHDELLDLDTERKAAETARAFVLEGWVPAGRFAALRDGLQRAVGDTVSVRSLARDEWYGEEAPVVLSNPRPFEPFERLTQMLPLPRYGTVDPTPFVAVFFPMLFGIIVGDIGYGAAMALVAVGLRWGAPARGVRRDVAKIAGAIAMFTIIFGVLYGELFGDLGRRWFGLHAVWLDREEAVIPFLTVAIALGVAHLMIGLVVGAIAQRRSDPRAALGRGITVAMLALLAVALLAVLDHLPGALFTPAIIGLLVAFPVLVLLEGFTGMLELFTVFGHVLSYARVMAVGTASVMLAVIANRMAGAFGSAAIGVVFALLFHLVNFAIALFSPTIHVLRLHYVEFFGTFYSPGGVQYAPLAHWKPAEAGS